jgi:hypothetical protein
MWLAAGGYAGDAVDSWVIALSSGLSRGRRQVPGSRGLQPASAVSHPDERTDLYAELPTVALDDVVHQRPAALKVSRRP